MKTDKDLVAKKLIVTAVDDSCPKTASYKFPVWEFENGLILVPSLSTNDYFFEDRESIEACGLAFVDSIEETEITDNWKSSYLLLTIQRSMREFGIDSVPQKHLELWK